MNKHWDKQSVRKTAKIFLDAEKKKSLTVRVIDEIVHWLLLVLVLFGNLFISGVLVFLSLFLGTSMFYALLILFALGFGTLLENPLQEIRKIDKNKHFLTRVMLPVFAVVNVYILAGVKALGEGYTSFVFPFNSFTAGTIYSIFFLLPHFTNWMRKKH